MAQETQCEQFLRGVNHLVVTAETYARPQTPDQFYMAHQARADAESLIMFTQEKLMFLYQRLKLLPELPDVRSLIPPEAPQEKEEESTHA